VRKRSQLTSTSPKDFEASIFLEKLGPQKTTLKIYYLVNQAGWSPVYNFYAKQSEKTVKVELNAHIQQLSGENWDGVKIILSNATPALSAVAPGLSPFRLSLSSSPTNQYNDLPHDLKSATQGISKKMNEAYNRQLTAQSLQETEESSWAMNDAANQFQNLEILAKGIDDLSYLTKEVTSKSIPIVNFQLKNTVSLPSRREQQMLRVEKYELPTEFYHVATPLLTPYVFREGEIENSSTEVLLEGPVNVYMNEQFVRKGEIPNVAKGQIFLMGFGINSQMRTKRELVDKKEKILGGNKEINFGIRITLENYNKEKIPLRILDRIPVEDEKENIRVTLDLKGNSLSRDELYERYQKPKGILRWDVELLGESSGAKSKLIEYSYKMEFDKNFTIIFPTSQKVEEMKSEFLELEKSRYKR